MNDGVGRWRLVKESNKDGCMLKWASQSPQAARAAGCRKRQCQAVAEACAGRGGVSKLGCQV